MTKTEMMRAMKALACLAAAIALPACAKAQEIAAGKVAFDADCSLCHDASPARATFQGPPLFGVVGRKTGAVAGFAYSAALKSAGAKGQVWTAAAHMEAAFARLSDAHREVLLLVVAEGLDATQAGAVLGLSPEAVRQRLRRARLGLAEAAAQGEAKSAGRRGRSAS